MTDPKCPLEGAIVQIQFKPVLTFGAQRQTTEVHNNATAIFLKQSFVRELTAPEPTAVGIIDLVSNSEFALDSEIDQQS